MSRQAALDSPPATARPRTRRRARAPGLLLRLAALGLSLVLLWVAHSALVAWLDTHAKPLQAGHLAWCFLWLLGSAWLGWAGWQAWRAAAAPAHDEHATARRLAGRAAVLLLALPWLAQLLLDAAPQAAERVQLALGRDPAGQLQFQAAADGRRLRLNGPIGLGDAERLQAQLARQPQLQLLELQASGTRLGEARRMAHGVQERGLQTRIVGACDNACVLLWLAGSARQVAATGQLGLSRPALPTADPLGAELLRRSWRAAWHGAGLPADFIDRGLHTPPGTPWSPDAAHLQASGLLDQPGGPLDVALPRGAGLAASELGEALLTHWLWRAMQARFPGSVELAAERVLTLQASDGGATPVPDAALQLAAQDVVQAALPAILAASDSLLHEQFIALLSDQLAAARPQGDAACTGVLQADATAKRGLPLPLRQREAVWLQDALASLPQAPPAQRRGDLEREVMRRALGDRAPALLASLWGPQRSFGADPGCQRAAELLAAVTRLPAAERRLAARLMFQPR